MPTTVVDADEPKFSQVIKSKLHPAQPPREVSSEKPDAAPPKPPVEEPPKKPAAESTPPPKPDAAPPASEDEAVFGTQPIKPAKGEKDKPPTDDEFEKTLAEETKGMKPKEQEAWNAIRRSEHATKDELRIAREELKAAAEARQEQKANDVTPKLEALTKENEALKLQLIEAEKDLSIGRIESSRKYRLEVSGPIGDIDKQAEEIAARYEVSPKSILDALREDPKTRVATMKELVADFEEADRVELYSLAKEMDRLNRKAESMREKSKADRSALEDEDREEEERTAAEVRQTLSASAQRTWDESAKTLAYLRPVSGAPEWNASLENAKTQVASYVPGQDAIADGRIRAQAAVLPFVLKERESLNKKLSAITEERDTLLARIEADNAHDPDLGGARDVDATGGDDEGEEGATLGQRIKAKVQR